MELLRPRNKRSHAALTRGWRRLPLNLRHLVTLIAGSGGAQIITIAASPFLSRLYSPTAFGVLTTFSAIIAVAAPGAMLRLDQAIPLPRKNHDAIALLLTSLAATLLCAIAAAILILVVPSAAMLSAELSQPASALLLGFGLLCAGLTQNLTQWNARIGSFNLLSKTHLTRSATTIILQLTLFAAGLRDAGMLLGRIAGEALATKSLSKNLRRSNFTIAAARIPAVLNHYKSFALFGAPQALISASSQHATPILLGYYFSLDFVGHYGLGHRMLAIPLSLVSSSIKQVLVPQLSRMLLARQAILPTTIRSTLSILVLGAPPALLVFWYGEAVFHYVFGSEWRLAGTIASTVAPWLLLGAANTPAYSVLQTTLRQRLLLVYDTTFLVARIGTLGLFVQITNDALTTLTAFVVTSCVFNVLLIALGVWAAHNADRNAQAA